MEQKTMTGFDAVFQVMEEWGMDHIYGYPGGSFDSGMNALYNQQDEMKFIRVAHEEAGALAAAAEAKLTGKIAACFGSAGPGAVHLLNGLYDAKEDHVPVLAIVAQVPRKMMNRNFFQAMDEKPIFEDVAVWNRTAMVEETLPDVIDEAIRQAIKYRGVAVVTIPKDLGWNKGAEVQTRANAQVEPAYALPDSVKVYQAYAMIKQAHAPMIYFGMGAKEAGRELQAVSEKFKLPLVSSLLAKGIIADNYPAYMGVSGRAGSKPASELGFEADLILWIGNDAPFSLSLLNPHAKVIQVDIDTEKFGKRHRADLSFFADAKAFLQELLKKGTDLVPTPFYQAALNNKQDWEQWLAGFNNRTDLPLRAEPIFAALSEYAAENALFTVDVGNVNINFQRLLKMKAQQKWTMSGIYGTMGYAVPASLGAAAAFPDHEIYSLSGDGAYAMMSQEILTQVKYGLHVINLVFSNQTLGYIEAEQRDDTDQPIYGTEVLATNWAMIAQGMGAHGQTVTTKAEFESALRDAKNYSGPTVIDIKMTTEMPFTTQHMFLDPAQSSPAQISSFKQRYEAQALKPFKFYLEKMGHVFEQDVVTSASKNKRS